MRYFQDPETNADPYGDAPIGVRLYDLNADGDIVGLRDYGLIYATQSDDAPYPTWTQKILPLSRVGPRPTSKADSSIPLSCGPGSDSTAWTCTGAGDDFVDVKLRRRVSRRRTSRLPLLGDLNCDGLVNNGDIDPFVLALTDLAAAYGELYPDCDPSQPPTSTATVWSITATSTRSWDC